MVFSPVDAACPHLLCGNVLCSDQPLLWRVPKGSLLLRFLL